MNRLKTILHAVHIVRDPNKLNEVINLADSIDNPSAMREIAEAVQLTEVGARALVDRPRVDVDLEALSELPGGTLGRAFADFMIVRNLDPKDLPKRPSDTPEAFIRAHLFETHDIWHVVTGFETDVAGELGLQAFYMAQLPGKFPPAILLVGMINTLLKNGWGDRYNRMDAIARGWQLGRRARPFFGTNWTELWSRPLTELRAEMNVSVN